jgi:L-rhamnose mutarotase
MDNVQRFCLTLDLRDDPGLIHEYDYWHNSEHIWPEIPAGIRAVGILNMEIYRLGTRLFMILESGSGFDFDRDMGALATLPRQQEWEAFVARFQAVTPGSTSAQKWQVMAQIFSLQPDRAK